MQIRGLERLAAFDRYLSHQTTKLLNTPKKQKVARILAHSGDSQFWLAGGFLLWWRGKAKQKKLGEQIISITILSSLFSYALKGCIHRPRPEGQAGVLYLSFDPHSFPSGHATRIGGLLATISSALPGHKRIALWLWGFTVCISRVALGIHFLGDITGGLLGGIGLGMLFLRSQWFRAHKKTLTETS